MNSLPNPFDESDLARDKLDQLYEQVQDIARRQEQLMECMRLLMRAENIRLDRAKNNGSGKPV